MAGGVQECDRCGARSELAAGFARRLTFSGRRTVCVACQRRSRNAGPLLVVILATPLLFMVRDLAVMGRLDLVWQQPGWLAAATAELYRSWVLTVLREAHLWTTALFVVLLVHETGHAVAARLLGDDVAEISLGIGPVVKRGRVGGTRLVLRALPLVGHTLIVPADGASRRRRSAVSIAAGPAAHAGVVVGAALTGAPGGFTRHLLWIGGISLLLNLVPRRAGGTQPTDGLQLLELARRPSELCSEAGPLTPAYWRAVACHLGRDLEGARRWCERGLATHPADTATEALLVAVLLELDEPGEARRRARHLLTAALPPERRAVTECNLAYADLLLGDPDLVGEAAEAVARATATLPWEPAVQATGAYVAITEGRIQEGMELVSRALEAESNPSQRAGMLAVRAIGYARAARFREAEGDLRAGARLQSDDVLVLRAAAEIERCMRLASGDRPAPYRAGAASTDPPPS